MGATMGAPSSIVPWTLPAQTQAIATAIVQVVPPYMGDLGQPRLYGVDQSGPNWARSCPMHTILAQVGLLTGGTAHTVGVLRPLNWSVVKVAGAINTTAFTLTDNPGLYSSNYKYPLGGGLTKPAGVADLTPANTHYYCVQLADGTWFFDILNAFSTTTFVVTTTKTIPNVAGGGVPKGAIFFLMGSIATSDPATGFLHPNIQANISVYTNFQDDYGLVSTLHPGDPMLIVDANATAADTITNISGYYRKVA